MKQAVYEHYWEKGWTVVEGVFSREEADRVAQIALETSQQELAKGGDSYVVDASSEGEIAPRKILKISEMPRRERSKCKSHLLI